MKCSERTFALRALSIATGALVLATIYKLFRLLSVGPTNDFSIAYGFIMIVVCLGGGIAIKKAQSEYDAGVLWFAYIGTAGVAGMAIMYYQQCPQVFPAILFVPLIAIPALRRTTTRFQTLAYCSIIGALILTATIACRDWPRGVLGLISTMLQFYQRRT